MRIINKNGKLNDTYIVSESARRLHEEGSVVLFPVAGTYSLVCRWPDEEAKDKIFNIRKNRSFQVFLWDIRDLPTCGIMFSRSVRKLARKLCPGPITIVDLDEARVGLNVLAEGSSLFQRLVEEMDCPLAVINVGKDADEMEKSLEKLYHLPDYAVNKGKLEGETTVFTVVEVYGKSSYNIVREGAIPEKRIKEILKPTSAKV